MMRAGVLAILAPPDGTRPRAAPRPGSPGFAMTHFLTLEQKVQALRDDVGDLKAHLNTLLGLTGLSLDDAMLSARRIVEHVVHAVLAREEMEVRRDLLSNLE